jgi:hypothetical protein
MMYRSGCSTHIMTEIPNPCIRLLTSMGGWLHAFLSNSSLTFDLLGNEARAQCEMFTGCQKPLILALWTAKQQVLDYRVRTR